MALVTINPNDTIVVAGVTYNIVEVGALVDSANTAQARLLGAKTLTIHLRKPGVGPVATDYRNTALGNAGGTPGHLNT